MRNRLPKDTKRLRFFSRDIGFDLRALARLCLHSAPWSKLEGLTQPKVDRARRVLRRDLATAWDSCTQFSEQLNQPLSVIVQDLIATSEPEDRVAYRLLLQNAKRQRLCTDKDWIDGIVNGLPVASDSYLLLQELVASERPPDRRTILLFLAWRPESQGFEAVFGRALNALARRDFRNVRALADLLQIGLLVPALIDRVNDAIYENSKEAISRASLRRKASSLRDKDIRTLIRQLPAGQIRYGLAVIVREPADRFDYFTRLPGVVRPILVRKLPAKDWQEILRPVSTRRLWLFLNREFEAISKRQDVMLDWASIHRCVTKLRSDVLRERLFDLLSHNQPISYALTGYLDYAANKRKVIPSCLARRYVTHATPRQMAKAVHVVSKVIPVLSSVDIDVCTNLQRVLFSRRDAKDDQRELLRVCLVQSLSRPLLQQLFDNERSSRLLRQSLNNLRGTQQSEALSIFIKTLTAPNLKLVTRTFRQGIQLEEFRVVCQSLDRLKVAPKGLLELKLPTGERAWRVYLRQAAEVPVCLRKVLIVAVPRSLEQAAELFPDTFAREACHRLRLRSALRLAFRWPSVAIELEKCVPRQRLVKEIPWVRRTWKDEVSRSAVFEVALAVSLVDFSYLLSLARPWSTGAFWNDYEVSVSGGNRVCGGQGEGKIFDELYSTYELPKKTGGTRTITVPDKPLRRLQRRILDNGFSSLPLHPAAHGFRRDHSVVTNATPHCRQDMVVRADIVSFFSNTRYPSIVKACRQLAGGSLSPRAVRFVADLCSYDGALPTGAPTSPVIGNIVLTSADGILAKVSRRYKIRYTRYADDLTFSGHGDTHRILPFVARVLRDLNYKLDQRKIHIFRKGRRQIVTGLVVNQRATLPRLERRRLRAAVHRRSMGKGPHWHGRPMDDAALSGRLAWLHMVEPNEELKYRRLLEKGRKRLVDT